jgi:hypothetical protein
MDHIIRRTRNSGDTIEVMERINTVAGIVLDSESHIDHVKILGKLSGPATISMDIDTLDHRLAILAAKNKAGGVYFKLGHVGHGSISLVMVKRLQCETHKSPDFASALSRAKPEPN